MAEIKEDNVKCISSYIKAFFEKIRNLFLIFIYDLDEWHSNTYERSSYAKTLVSKVNKIENINRMNVLEVGCGIGNIIRHIECDKKYAYDSDPKVLKALRFCDYKMRIEILMQLQNLERMDIILAINFLHGYSENEVIKFIKDLSNNKFSGWLIIDVKHFDKADFYDHTRLFVEKYRIRKLFSTVDRTFFVLNYD